MLRSSLRLIILICYRSLKTRLVLQAGFWRILQQTPIPMERQEIPIRYAELRHLANTVPASLAYSVGVEDAVNLRTAIEDDFGIVGLDTEMLLVEFGKKYQVDLTNFDFTGLITPEPNFIDSGDLIRLLLLIPAWFIKAALALVCWPFNHSCAMVIWKTSLRKTLLTSPAFSPPAQVLRVGDFVASAAAGYFVKREQVRFVLV